MLLNNSLLIGYGSGASITYGQSSDDPLGLLGPFIGEKRQTTVRALIKDFDLSCGFNISDRTVLMNMYCPILIVSALYRDALIELSC